MAKNPFWLRGANGKLAGAVVYQSGGKTIIRENVTPSNPQTIPQIVQRLAFATVSKAASLMGNLVDHSFEGIKPGPDSKRYFIKRNVGIIRQKLIDDYINKNVGSHANAFVQAKNTAALIPNNYLIANGTLPILFRVWRNSSDLLALQIPINGWFGNAGVSTLLEVIQAYGLQPGDEISVHAIMSKYSAANPDFPPLYTVPEGARAGGVILESQYKGVRAVLQDVNWEGWQNTIPTVGTVEEPPTPAAATAAMKEFLFGEDPIFNMEKSDAPFVAELTNLKFIEDAQILIDGPALQWRIDPTTPDITIENCVDAEGQFSNILAASAILSRVVDGEAKRSPAIMMMDKMDEDSSSTWYGLDIWSALESYTDKSLSDLFREWLDQGGQRNTLT